MCCKHFLCVLQEIFSPTMQCTTSVLKLSWHCESLSGISSNCHLVEEWQAFDTCIRTSGAVMALHNSLRNKVLYFYLFAYWFICVIKIFIFQWRCVTEWQFFRCIHSQDCKKRLLDFSCLSNYPTTWNNSASTRRIFMKFVWEFF
jgi:hypothetical protein